MLLGGKELPQVRLYPCLRDLWMEVPEAAVVALDMPIGLKSEMRQGFVRRRCDAEARRALGRRGCCVFDAPARGVLDARHGRDAEALNQWHRTATGLGLSRQTMNLLPKIAEVDAVLCADTRARAVVHEVHPELSFAHWAGQGRAVPLAAGKKTPAGQAARAALVEGRWPGVLQAAEAALGTRSCAGQVRWAYDDLLDALAALWTAERITQQKAVCYPAPSARGAALEVDACGLSMQIWA